MCPGIFKTVLVILIVTLFKRLSATSDYLGCFEDDSQHPGFRYIPVGLDPAHVTPLACLHACLSRYQYAALASKRVCLCGNEVNVTLKVSDERCSQDCTLSRGSDVCDHVVYYDVYWKEKSIIGLVLNMDREVELFSRTWFNASVLGQVDTEFRFEIDGEIISSWSNSSFITRIFTKKGEHSVRVTARNNFGGQATVQETLKTGDSFQSAQFRCPAAALAGAKVICRGEWRAGTGTVLFDYGDGSSENVNFDTPMHVPHLVSELRQEISETRNTSDATYVLTTAVNPEPGEVSHWALVATKPGTIKVQVFRPYCNTTDNYSQALCFFQQNTSGNNIANTEEPICLSLGQCAPLENAQNTSYHSDNTTSVAMSYELVSEDVINIPNVGYHVFRSPSILSLQGGDVIGWTSDGGMLRYTVDHKSMTLEYPDVGRTGSKLRANSYTMMHFGAHALTAYIRQPLKFELYHVFQNPGVYEVRSPNIPTMSIIVDYPITPFTLNVPNLSPTNATVFLKPDLRNGTGVTYSWNFGDGNTKNCSTTSTTHLYDYPARFLITLHATNSVSNFTVHAGIEILDPIRDCHFVQPIRAVVAGEPTFLKWRCSSGSNVTFSVNLDDGQLSKFLPISENFIGNSLSYTYTSAAHYIVKIAVSSPLGVIVNLTERALVEIPVEGLETRLLGSPPTEVLYIATLSEISVERVLSRGTHVMCVFDFGDSTFSVTSSEQTMNHTYRSPGNYRVNTTCYNHVSTTWVVLNTTIIVEDVLPLNNLTLTVPSAIFETTSKFELIIPYGNLFTCDWDFEDETIHTTSYPQVDIIIPHLYREVGTYNVSVTCRNVLGEISVTVLAKVDEPIQNVSLVNENSFASVNQSVAFILTLSAGSRVNYCIDCHGKAKYLGRNVTMAIITHACPTPGQHMVAIRLWNSVSSVTITALKLLTVQYPVKGIQISAAQATRCQSFSVAVCLTLSKNIQPPSNASVLFNYGDGSTASFEVKDFKSRTCFEEHQYTNTGLYNIIANVTNHVSSQYLMVSVQVQQTSLSGINVMFKNGSVFQKGLGVSNGYFPTGDIVRFEIEEHRDDISYEWRIGNDILGEARIVERMFLTSGCHNITVVTKSLSLDENCFSNICIEEILHDLHLNVVQPTYFKDPTVLMFSVENKTFPACYRLNLGDNTTVHLGDNTAVTFGPSACGSLNISSYTHVYKQRGDYTVSLTRWNHVSSITCSVDVFILDEACGNVGVFITGGGFKDRPTIVRGSETLVLTADITHNCHVAEMVFVDWSVFVFGEKDSVLSDRQEITVYKNSSKYFITEFVIRGSSLSTQLYVVEVSVGFLGVDRDLRNISGSNYTWFEVSRPRLIARIKGGVSRSVPWNEEFHLDGSRSLNLGNIPSKLHFIWTCRLATISYPMANNTTSCFRDYNGILGNSSVLVVYSGSLDYNQEYLFRLEMREGRRKSFSEQAVFVQDGPVPSLDLRCIVNCKESINPSKRLLLESKCSNCEVDTRLEYHWSLYTCGSLMTPSCAEIPHFQTRTSTGVQGPNIAILENALEIGAMYRVRCTASRFGSENTGYVEYLLTVNSPPTNGYCSVTPDEGFAVETLFNVFCFGWWDEEQPLTYLLEIQNGDYRTYLAAGRKSNISIRLPLGSAERNFSVNVVVKVADGRLFSTTTMHPVKVLRPSSVNYSRVIHDVEESANLNENDEAFGLVLSLCSIMNYNQTVSRRNLTNTSKVRVEIAHILATTNITELANVRGIGDAFEALTAKPDETGLELQSEATKTIQRTVSIVESLVNTSQDISVVGTSLHRVLSNIVGAVLLTSVNTITMGTNISVNNTEAFADTKAHSILNTFQTVDEVNSVLLQQVLAGDQSTIITTKNYDIKLAKLRLEDLIMSDRANITSFPVTFHDGSRLMANTNSTEISVLGLMVTDLSQTPSSLYDASAEEINSNILRVNFKDSLGRPVEISNLDLDIFIDNRIPEQFSEIYTHNSRNSLKFYRFNRSSFDASLVLLLRAADPNLSLRAFLSIGQRPTLGNFHFQTKFTANNLTSGDSSYTWVLSRDVLRNVTSPESEEYFLGVLWNEGLELVNKSYTLRVSWVKCFMSEEGEGTWASGQCEVGKLTSSRRTHCVCRPGQVEATSESDRNPDHARRRRRSTGRKKTFKIAVGAGVFPAPNKIDFNYVFDTDVSNNSLALVAVSTLFGIYLVLLVCARRRDVKDSKKIGVTVLPGNRPSDKYFYEVTVYTGSVYDAGTSAHVSIILSGAERDLGPRILYDPMRQCFQRSAIDTFLISSRDIVGDVSYLQIWHDNVGSSPSWFLEKVVVRDLNDDKSYIFFNESWLAVESKQGRTQTVLFPACKEEIAQFKRLFNSTIHSSLRDRHLWFSLLSRPVDSRFTLVQRLSCCLSLLYTTMLANAMYYRGTEASTSETSITIGPFMFGLREVSVGLMSAMIIVPINACIVGMFRNTEAKPSSEELAARRAGSRFWWFFEVFFCCFKSRQASSGIITLMTRNLSDYFYNEQKSEDSDKPCSSPSVNSVKNLDISVEVSNETIKLSKKCTSSPRPSSIQLPYWYIYVVWSLVCLTSVSSAFFVVLYGLQFGRVVSSQWLSSMTVSFVQDVFINEPLKVFAIAVVVALIIKKPQDSDHENKDRERTIVDHHILQNTDSILDEYHDPFHLKAPNKKDLEMARIQRLKELRTGALLKELCLYIMFLFCLSAVTYKNKNPMSFQVNKTMRDLLLGKHEPAISLKQITNMKDFLTWTNGTFLNALFSTSYNESRFPDETNAVFGNYYLVGCVRLYQEHDSSASSNNSSKYLFLDIQSSNGTGNTQNIHFTKINNWLNTEPREITIEFNIYNPSLNLFCLSKLTVKVLPTNGIETRANFVVRKLFAVGGILDTFSLVSHIFVFVFFVVFTYRELKQIYRLKRRYFGNIWNVLQGILVLLILSSIIVFFIRLVMIEDLMASLVDNQERFVAFDTVVFVDTILGSFIAFVVFLSWLRVTKFLRFNRRLSFLQDTLCKMAKPLAAFSVVFMTIFTAYVHSGYLVFSRELQRFHDLETTFTSLCGLFMGDFDFPSLQNSNRVIGPLFIFSALFFGGFIIINLLIALILESFLVVKIAAARRPNKYELLEYIKKHLRHWFRATGSQCREPGEDTPGGIPLREIIPVGKTPGDKYLGGKTPGDKSRLKNRIAKQDTILARIEKSVSDLMTSLECVCEEDWHEEVILYKLILKGLGLGQCDWLDYARDLKNLEDLEMIVLRHELYEAVEKYSPEEIDGAQNSGGLVPRSAQRSFSAFELNFEEDSF